MLMAEVSVSDDENLNKSETNKYIPAEKKKAAKTEIQRKEELLESFTSIDIFISQFL